MKETIKAEVGYHIIYSKKDEIIDGTKIKQLSFIPQDSKICYLFDGSKYIIFAKLRSYEDYIDECKNGNNECAQFKECFKTIDGKKYIYWCDTEINRDFLTEIDK